MVERNGKGVQVNGSMSASWRKSSYSNGQGECIEVADGFSGVVPVRDSKDPDGPALVFHTESFKDFITAVKSNQFPVL
jgi:hypothetical protein